MIAWAQGLYQEEILPFYHAHLAEYVAMVDWGQLFGAGVMLFLMLGIMWDIAAGRS